MKKAYIYVHYIGGRCLTRILSDQGVLLAEQGSSARRFCEDDIRDDEKRLRSAGWTLEWVHDPLRHDGLVGALRRERDARVSSSRQAGDAPLQGQAPL